MIRQLIVFGTSGDLTARYLLPAVAQLHAAGLLPDDLAILGLAREEWDTPTFRCHAAERLERHAPGVPPAAREAVVAKLQYRQVDVADRDAVAAALGRLEQPIVAYLALPPSLFAPTIEALAGVGLPDGSRVAIEKPFGENLTSARALNRLLHACFPEEAVFRVDHFLAMQTVQNILGLRFANRIFEPLWNGQHVERVDIIWDETLTLEGRAGYYDRAGALRDMLQNHLLQLLCLVAMEVPLSLEAEDFRQRKVEVLRAVRRLSPEDVPRYTRRARYTAGRIGGRRVPAYTDEPGVDPARRTETFAEMTLWTDNWRWAGVPFLLRSGKALRHDRAEVAISFKPVPHVVFGPHVAPRPNVLRLELLPERLALGVTIHGPGGWPDLEAVELDRALAPQALPAYARLLLDILRGDPTLSIRADEAEESWRIVEPVLDAWGEDRVPLLEYPAGSDGPVERGPWA